jgi:hypothetical protein
MICPWLMVLKMLWLMDLRILVLFMGLNMLRILLHVMVSIAFDYGDGTNLD